MITESNNLLIEDLTFGYGRDALDAAFKKVQNRKNWKYPVSAVIPESEFEVTSAAVAFFTGSNLDVTRRYKNGNVRVYAVGYYVAIGP